MAWSAEPLCDDTSEIEPLDVLVMSEFRRSNAELHVRQLREIDRVRRAAELAAERAAEVAQAAAQAAVLACRSGQQRRQALTGA